MCVGGVSPREGLCGLLGAGCLGVTWLVRKCPSACWCPWQCYHSAWTLTLPSLVPTHLCPPVSPRPPSQSQPVRSPYPKIPNPRLLPLPSAGPSCPSWSLAPWRSWLIPHTCLSASLCCLLPGALSPTPTCTLVPGHDVAAVWTKAVAHWAISVPVIPSRPHWAHPCPQSPDLAGAQGTHPVCPMLMLGLLQTAPRSLA